MGQNVGTKTTMRFMNHARSRMACCSASGRLPGNEKKKDGISLVLWHPGNQARKQIYILGNHIY